MVPDGRLSSEGQTVDLRSTKFSDGGHAEHPNVSSVRMVRCKTFKYCTTAGVLHRTFGRPHRPQRTRTKGNMHSSLWRVLLLQAVLATSSLALLAFPGAEGRNLLFSSARDNRQLMDVSGFGAQATGGRTGSVYVVTNLNDSGTGACASCLLILRDLTTRLTRQLP